MNNELGELKQGQPRRHDKVTAFQAGRKNRSYKMRYGIKHTFSLVYNLHLWNCACAKQSNYLDKSVNPNRYL